MAHSAQTQFGFCKTAVHRVKQQSGGEQDRAQRAGHAPIDFHIGVLRDVIAQHLVARAAQQRRRSPYSDKQYYQEYILQRIEGYKNSIGRDELLRLGDEAAAELQTAAEGQFLLTEVLMLESVDRLIVIVGPRQLVGAG